LYLKGHGVEQNYTKALQYFQKASKNGNFESLNNLGIMYENGFGVEKDLNKALEYYKKSAEQKFKPAIENYERLKKTIR
ncbi:sel1 repeat family protein, partial [bacterium]|nr:sel1 repeat family protein [bacterium]